MSDSEVQVAVVILGWNGKRFLQDFLPSVVQYSAGESYQVVYADNASTDDSVAFVQANFPSVRIVQNKSNSGFAGGYNEALQQVKAKYYVLLNQDVEVTENWIAPVVSFLESNPNYAAAQPKLRAYHEKDAFEYAGAAGGFMDYLGFAFCRGRLFDTMEKDFGQYDNKTQIFWGSGACLFVRSEVYWSVGGLDEDFFAHQEEIDLCWRIQNAGKSIWYVPESTVYHVGGGSLPQGNPRKTYLNFRNNLFLLLKNLPASRLWWTIPVRLKLDWIAILYSLLKNKNGSDAKAILKAHRDFWKSFAAMYAKRSNVIPALPETVAKQSIIVQYYLQGKKKFSEL
jgi:GT2 family glycosyltransferase